MARKKRRRKPKRQQARILGKYTPAEVFLAVLGAAILFLAVALVVTAIAGG